MRATYFLIVMTLGACTVSTSMPADDKLDCEGLCEPEPMCPSTAEVAYRDCFTREAWACDPAFRVYEPEGCGCYCEPELMCPSPDEVEYRGCFTREGWACEPELRVSDPNGCGCYCLSAE